MTDKNEAKLEEKAIEIEKTGSEIATTSSPRSVIVDAKQLKDFISHEKEIREILTEYITSELKAGVDYGTIKMTSRSGKDYESKPSLFKPGSEKFCAIMHLRPTFEKDSDTWEMSGKQAGLYCYVCKLVNEKGQVVGEGRGAADINEKQNANVAIKIAQKRAQVDAVIRTGQLSDFFTQDLEDLGVGTENGGKSSKPVSHATLNVSQQVFQKYWIQLKDISSQEDVDKMKEAVDTEVDLSDKQKSYLKDLANKKVTPTAEEVADEIPF